ncbi:MAG TPA: ABC transporter permease [Gammaproteobacteria bacterium]|nr:ABC transporter permease [Gammaproteobacteria bacterium]
MPVFALVGKEWKLLLRDWHALLLLFAMPAIFILVMSLALQDSFALHQGVSVHYYLVNEDIGPVSAALVKRLDTLNEFNILPADAPVTELIDRVRHDRAQFIVRIPAGFSKAMLSEKPRPVQMLAGPDVEPAIYKLFEAALRDALGRVYLQKTMAPLQVQMAALGGIPGAGANLDAADKLLNDQSLYQVDGEYQRPSSVQQNVPAWLLFAMFFIAIPLSTTWVQERQQGTYARLRSMGLSSRALLLGKLLPYLGVNLLQVVLMLAVGIFVVPWFGGGRLTLGHAPLALCLMAVAVSFAAVAYALLIANLVSTSEQATIFTGVSNLLMAAVGGIMVPRFLMPPMMQALSQYSPMAWGLQGFLDIFLRQGGFKTVAPQAAYLFAFGLGCLTIAGLLLSMRKRK